MNKIKNILSSRRIKGLFASIVENGSMISLVGTWKPVKEGMSTLGLETKTVSRRGKDVLFYRYPGLTDLVNGFGWRVLSFCFPNRVKFTRRLLQLYKFSNYIYLMYKHHGSTQAVKFLKAAQLAVQKSIAKDKIDNLRQLDDSLFKSKLTGYGLPTIIPSRDRKMIAAGSTPIIRWWLTLFSVYRVISIPGKLKLFTIVQASTVSGSIANIAELFSEFLRSGLVWRMFDKRILYREARFQWLETASPTHKVSWKGIYSNPKLLTLLGLSDPLRQILILLDQKKLLLLFDTLVDLDLTKEKLNPISEFIPGEGRYSNAKCGWPKGSYVGKLSIKEEAAGKLRVFALVDVWTQNVLKPVHDMLFTFLKSLPNDGTFDQHASEMRAREKAMKCGHSFGYDLTAATDRLPIELQIKILNLLVPTLGDHWKRLLVDRDYYLYLPDAFQKEIALGKDPVPNTYDIGEGNLIPIYYDLKGQAWVVLRYAVGQPMGALSSWAMLAVTHHYILQLAFRRARSIPNGVPFTLDSWYSNYELLGDDIIIFDKDIAAEYLVVMAELGVPINVTKSVVATVPATEFAKVTSLYGKNVSALSWKMFMSGNSLMGRVNIAFMLLSKGVVSKNIIPWLERSLALSPWKPGNPTASYVALWTMLANRGLITMEDALRALIDGKTKVFRYARAVLLNADTNKIKLALPGIITGKGVHIFERKTVQAIFNIELPWFRITMWKPLAVFRAKANISEDCKVLADAIFESLLLEHCENTTPEEFKAKYCTLLLEEGNFFQDGVPVVSSVYTGENYGLPDEMQISLQILYANLYTMLLEKVEHLSEPILTNSIEMDSPTALLVEMRDKLDRYNEFLQLVHRMNIKYSDEGSPPVRNVRGTELKLIKLISKMGNRPLFTTANNLW